MIPNEALHKLNNIASRMLPERYKCIVKIDAIGDGHWALLSSDTDRHWIATYVFRGSGCGKECYWKLTELVVNKSSCMLSFAKPLMNVICIDCSRAENIQTKSGRCHQCAGPGEELI